MGAETQIVLLGGTGRVEKSNGFWWDTQRGHAEVEKRVDRYMDSTWICCFLTVFYISLSWMKCHSLVTRYPFHSLSLGSSFPLPPLPTASPARYPPQRERDMRRIKRCNSTNTEHFVCMPSVDNRAARGPSHHCGCSQRNGTLRRDSGGSFSWEKGGRPIEVTLSESVGSACIPYSLAGRC